MKSVCAALAASWVVFFAAGIQAEEPKPVTPTVPLAVPAASPIPAPDDHAAADIYKVPEKASSDELVKFCIGLMRIRPNTQQEYDEIIRKRPSAIRQACEKILEIEKSDTTENGRFAKRNMLIFKFQEIGDPRSPEARKVLEEVMTFITNPKFTREDAFLAIEIGSKILERMDEERAMKFYEQAVKVYSTSKDPTIQSIVASFEGTLRRTKLVGSEMIVKGNTVNGKPFDLAALKGKVVMVDFWATWCPSCVQEIPNVKRQYANYHAKGFEVVAISADQDRPRLDEFLAQNEIPWINLHEDEGRHSAILYYGIHSFPTTVIIGKDGKVVAMNLHGREIGDELQKLLGDPEPMKETPGRTPAAPAADVKPTTHEIIGTPSSDKLVEYCKKLEAIQPASREEAESNRTAMKQACAKILEQEKGADTENARFAKRMQLVLKFQESGDPGSPVAKQALNDLIAFVTDPKYSPDDVVRAIDLGQLLEHLDEKRAIEFYTLASKQYATSKDPGIREIAEGMQGSVRRFSLVGNDMSIKGTTVEGGQFDLTSLKGKVVLVDFWATWCSNCVRDMGAVKKLYDMYHEKGFEVVAISADDDRARLDDFLAKNKFPWTNLHERAGRHPALQYYGIHSYPTTILIGQDGKVISINPLDEKLQEQVKKLLGATDSTKPAAAAPQTSDPLKDALKEALKTK